MIFLSMGLSTDTGAVVSILKESLYKRNSSPPVILGEAGMSLIKDIVMRALDLQDLQLAEALLTRVDKQTQKEHALALSRVFARYECWDTALYYAEVYAEGHADRADAWFQTAEILFHTHQYERACLCYRRALTLDPRQPQYYVKLITLYQTMRQELLAEAVRKYPGIAIFSQILEEAADT